MLSLEYGKALDRREIPFLVMEGCDFMNVNKVHPYKQKCVGAVCSSAKSEFSGIVSKIIVFGSSVTYNCRPWSDLDICIEWKHEFRDDIMQLLPEPAKFIKVVESSVRRLCICHELDIVFLNDNDGHCSLYNEIMEKGVVVYE